MVREHCLTGGNASEFDLWISRYAELLGCENRAGAVAVAIQSLIEKAELNDHFKQKYFGMVAKQRAELKRINPCDEDHLQ